MSKWCGLQGPLAVATVLACVAGSRAAHISEIFLEPGSGAEPSWPDAVELDLLDPASAYDLLVMDASADNRYDVVQVVRLTTAEPLVLISESPWPVDLWSAGSTTPQSRIDIHDDAVSLESATGGLDLRGARTLLLFEGQTDFQAGRVDYRTQLGNGRDNDATLVDWLTLSSFELDWQFDGEQVHDLVPGQVIAVPFDEQTAAPAPQYTQQGPPDALGRLAGADPPLALTPGFQNPIWTPSEIPEAGAVTLVLIGLACATHSRRFRRRA